MDVKRFQESLVRWYRRNRRELPWRSDRGFPPAYHVLLSELMLQQTQVVTVIPYFARFLERFPTIADLASADEQEVLRLWQGLGYYSRARNLHRAAKMIVERFAGQIPEPVEDLLELPGIGRYTAGAVSSLAYGRRSPILDGNVQRVLCRVYAIGDDPRGSGMQTRLWGLAEELLPDTGVAEFNSGLMELGATICTPRNPQCLSCPVRGECRAMALGVAEQIPPAKRATARPTERRWVFCIVADGRVLIEQRPADGRWGGMWQFLTVPARAAGKPLAADIQEAAGGLRIAGMAKLAAVKHDLTHRRYQFQAWRVEAERAASAGRGLWVRVETLDRYPMSKPQLRIARMAFSMG